MAERIGAKRLAAISITLFVAWVVASILIRIVLIVFFNMKNSEISVAVVSGLAVALVIAWLNHERNR